MNILKIATLTLGLGSMLAMTSCGEEDVEPTLFTVTIENVSQPNTVMSERAGGAVPLSPPVWAQYEGSNPMFDLGGKANLGTERIAEDGFATEMLALLGNDEDVINKSVETSEGGPDEGPALFPGESVTFSFTADEEDEFQFMTMFVQSNDWFISVGEDGLELFSDGRPINGDITSRLRLYDAGTEVDTPAGSGPHQKPVQGPDDVDFGDKEDEDIAAASERHPDYVIPNLSDVIKVTISN